MLKIEYLEKEIPVYDITVKDTHNFFANDILVHNCVEITLPTFPLEDIDESYPGAIALCILSAINVGKVKSDAEFEGLCDLAVRGLDELIDYQQYPVKVAEIETKARRSLGIGFIGLAHYLAKLGFKYGDQEAVDAVHSLAESFQYYLLKASNQLAIEKGACDYFNRTKYSDGILPIDTYKKDVDELVTIPLQHDWEELRESIKKHGLRNSTLSAQMPSESSAVVSNATNGIEPPREFITVKKSKKGPLKQLVPQYERLKNDYTLLWEMESNIGYIKIVSVMQKFFDQSISGNSSYNPEFFVDTQIPMSVLMNDLLLMYKYGWKTLYYNNTYDGKNDNDDTTDENIHSLLASIVNESEEMCDACAI